MRNNKFNIDTGGEDYKARVSVPTAQQMSGFNRSLANDMPSASMISKPMDYVKDAMSRGNYSSLLGILKNPDALEGMVMSTLPNIGEGALGNTSVPGFSQGGPVSQAPKQPIGPGDTEPAMLDPDEFVLRPEATQALGMDALHMLNALDTEQLPKQPADRLRLIGELLIELAQENSAGSTFPGGLGALQPDGIPRSG